MSDKHHVSNQPDNPEEPPLESAGRSIEDDLLIETLVQVVHQNNAIPMAKAMVSLLFDSSSSPSKSIW